MCSHSVLSHCMMTLLLVSPCDVSVSFATSKSLTAAATGVWRVKARPRDSGTCKHPSASARSL